MKTQSGRKFSFRFSFRFSFVLIGVALIWTPNLPAQTANTCQKACLINADCGDAGSKCLGGFCQHEPTFCVNDRWSGNQRGETEDCGAYTCDGSSGLCHRSATDPIHCSFGYVMNGQTCAPSIVCDAQNATCAGLLKNWQAARDQWLATYPAPNLAVYSCVACDEHNPCGGGQMCWNQRCVAAGSYCGSLPTGSGSFDATGASQSCQAYSCGAVSGECRTDCVQDSDCNTGMKCGTNRQCAAAKH